MVDDHKKHMSVICEEEYKTANAALKILSEDYRICFEYSCELPVGGDTDETVKVTFIKPLEADQEASE